MSTVMEEESFDVLVKRKLVEEPEEDASTISKEESHSKQEDSNQEILTLPTKRVKRQPPEENILTDIVNHQSQEAPGAEEEKQKNVTHKPNKPKKPLTAYFIFLREYKNRDDKEKLTSLNIHKDLANIWSTMTKDEKQIYINKAQEDQDRYNKELEVYKAALNENQLEDSDEEAVGQSKVKKIIKSDPEVRKTKKTTCEFIAKLTEAFGAYLIEEASKNMKLEKRKKLGVGDLK